VGPCKIKSFCINSMESQNKICQDAFLWPAESVFIGWLSASLLATTAALLFYHMSDAGTLPIKIGKKIVNKRIAGVISSGLILSAVIYATAGIIPYNMRVSDCYSSEPENAFRWIDTFMGGTTILIEMMIAILIIKDSFFHTEDPNKNIILEALADIVNQRMLAENASTV
jgi:hypothetical protein